MRALLTMRVRVLCTFIATGLADIGASCADRFGELTAPGHETSGHPANGSTVDIEGDAARHHLDIVFLQAGGGTVVARVCTGIAGINAGSILLMSHGEFSQRRVKENSMVLRRLGAPILFEAD